MRGNDGVGVDSVETVMRMVRGTDGIYRDRENEQGGEVLVGGP